MEKKKIFAVRHFSDLIYIFLISAGAVAAAVERAWASVCIMAAGLLCVAVFARLYYRAGQNRMVGYLGRFSAGLKGAEAEAVSGFPFPVAILSPNGKILWYNAALQEALSGELLFQRDIKSIIPEFDADNIGRSGIKMRVNIFGRHFQIFAHRVKSARGDGEKETFVYFIDISELQRLEGRIKSKEYAELIIYVDNYEEAMKDISGEQKASLGVAIERTIRSLEEDTGGVLKRLERDKYFLIISRGALNALITKKFSILDKVREIAPEAAIPPTLSIGVGDGGGTLGETDAFAKAALDMALGRGGDQVVVKDGEGFKYFGGRTREVEKHTRVKARVVAHALRELAAQNGQILVMGHKNADIDSFGAGIGLLAYARSAGLRAHTILNTKDKIVTEIAAMLRCDEKYSYSFISPEHAREIITDKTLLIIVDTHKPSYVEAPELLKYTDQIAVIDHHRRSAEFISNPVLLYHEPYASSVCEMVTEMLQYMGDSALLGAADAMALYAGIYLDTKGFTFKTGVRTLEAAAYLRRQGADPVLVKNMFRTDLDSYLKRAQIIGSAVIYRENLAIADSEKNLPQSVIAQTADELINIADINTAFVVAPSGEKTVISARSTGIVNVQLILEKLEGGGHMTIAGVQLEDVSVPDALGMLRGAIDEYFKDMSADI